MVKQQLFTLHYVSINLLILCKCFDSFDIFSAVQELYFSFIHMNRCINFYTTRKWPSRKFSVLTVALIRYSALENGTTELSADPASHKEIKKELQWMCFAIGADSCHLCKVFLMSHWVFV